MALQHFCRAENGAIVKPPRNEDKDVIDMRLITSSEVRDAVRARELLGEIYISWLPGLQ